MDKITKYQNIVLAIIQMFATETESNESEHEEIITDLVHHHYFLQWLGFDAKDRFINKPILHFHIKSDGKVWILANLTESDVAEMLVEKGVDKNDVVVGFHPQKLRAHTGYAIA
jgi:hypothetical protein